MLGNAVFSQCRNLVHWGCGGGEGACYWLVAALARMEELAGAAPRVACVYRFEDAVEEAVAGFCGRALPDRELPAFAEYRVHDAGALDAYVDEVRCTMSLPDGFVDLVIEASQSAWCYEGQPASERASGTRGRGSYARSAPSKTRLPAAARGSSGTAKADAGFALGATGIRGCRGRRRSGR